MLAAFGQALLLILKADPGLVAIVLLSLKVSLTAVAIAAVIALPLAALLALRRLAGHRLLVTLINTMMSLPPVIVGLFVFTLLSRNGLLGVLELLYTPAAMITAQCILVTPIIAGIAYELLAQRMQSLQGLFLTYRRSLGFEILTLLYDARLFLLTAIVAGLGRAFAEVGAVMIVGGNIAGLTRVLTTAIVLESSKGQFEQAMALGMILLVLSLALNACLMLFRRRLVRPTPT